MRGNDAYSRSVAAPIARRSRSRSSSARSPFSERSFVEILPQIVKQQRILAQFLRKHPLGQAGREHDLERTAPGLMRAADEDAPVAIRRRLDLERQQSSGEDVADFEQRDRSDCSHRAQIGEHAQHVFGLSQDARREPSRRCSQSPQVASSGHSEIVSTSGSAKARRCSRFCSSRSKCGMRDESGSSSVSSRICRRYCSARPFRRRAQRSLPPITADSTSRLSHFQGARRVPDTTAAGSVDSGDLRD